MTYEEAREKWREECDEIAAECTREGYPAHGSNYEIRAERAWEYWKGAIDSPPLKIEKMEVTNPEFVDLIVTLSNGDKYYLQPDYDEGGNVTSILGRVDSVLLCNDEPVDDSWVSEQEYRLLTSKKVIRFAEKEYKRLNKG